MKPFICKRGNSWGIEYFSNLLMRVCWMPCSSWQDAINLVLRP